jgi:hypothetical protein
MARIIFTGYTVPLGIERIFLKLCRFRIANRRVSFRGMLGGCYEEFSVRLLDENSRPAGVFISPTLTRALSDESKVAKTAASESFRPSDARDRWGHPR